MFKFVTPSPKQYKNNDKATTQCWYEDRKVGVVIEKARRTNSLFRYLNKHQDKASAHHKSKHCSNGFICNLDQDLTKISPPKYQRSNKLTTTNTDLPRPQNSEIALEESQSVKQNTNQSAGETAQDARRIVTEDETYADSDETLIASHRSGFDDFCDKGVRSAVPKDVNKRQKKSRPRPKSTGDEFVVRTRREKNMTHDYHSASDCDSDSAWLDQPSPILLTSSPPRNAVKVPATRLPATDINNDWECSVRGIGLDENSNFLQNGTDWKGSDRTISGIQQEASDLFCQSLRDTTRYAKFLPEASKGSTILSTQSQHFYNKVTPPTYNGSRSTSDRDQTPVNAHENERSQTIPTSGPIFVGGALFLTEEDEYTEYPRHGKPTKEYSGSEQTITGSLYPISNHNKPFYTSNSEITFHNHIDSKKHGDQQTMNGYVRYCDRTSEQNTFNFQYNRIISVDDAKFLPADQMINTSNGYISMKNVPNAVVESSRKTIEHPKVSGTITKSTSYGDRSNSSATENIEQTRSNSGSKRSKHQCKKGSKHAKNMQFPRKTRPSEDEDDDATTLTMITVSDDVTELSSSSSSSDSGSTACGSISSVRTSNVGYQPSLKQTISAEDTTESFVIEKVEITGNVNYKINGFSSILSPEERRVSLQRSISTQSGKLRDRLNAVTGEESDIYDTTPRGSTTEVINFVEYPESDLDMPSASQYTPSEVSPSQLPHSRVTQLKGEASPSGTRSSRSLSRIPARMHSPTQSRRCRSLDRGLRGSFRSALSPAHSDLGAPRSLLNFRRRNSVGSDSDVSPVSTLSRSRLRKARSSNSLADRYKPKIDVAESLSALILNPINGGINDRRTLSDYLKRSSKSTSNEQITLSTEELRWRNSKHGRNYSPSYRASYHSGSGSSCGGRTPDNRLLFEEVKLDSLSLSAHSSLERSRESKIVSKSQTPNRYPTVHASPRSISALLPSPRRNIDAETEVITILDNDVASTGHVEYEGNRRNSFIEAVTGASSENAYSSNSELYTADDDLDGSTKTNNLSMTAKDLESKPRQPTFSDSAYLSDQNDNIPNEGESPFSAKLEISPEEVNVNLTTHPVSNDLAVAVIRRPSLRNPSTSSISSKTSSHRKLTNDKYYPPDSVANTQNRTHNSSIKPTVSESEPTYVNIAHSNKYTHDSLEEIVTVKCRNPRCRREMCLEDGKSKFKSCHHCYTYYCSIQCRQAHWERHKLKCMFARVNSDCKKILRMGREDDVIKQAFTRVARTGYLSRGRGCVQVIFSCPEKAEQFVAEGLFALESLPLYRTVNDLVDFQKRISNVELIPDDLIQTCETEYDAEKTYVLQVLIDIPKETLSYYNRPYRNRDANGVYIHAVNPVYKVDQGTLSPREIQQTPETLILTPPTTIPETWLTTSPSGFTRSASSSGSQASSPLNTSGNSNNKDELRHAKRARQLCFINIQRKLREKGVTLRHQYPDVYRKLCAYVDTGTHFTPVVIYPQDTRSGKNFMCLVMPGSEPQILGWVQTPGLLDDIATG